MITGRTVRISAGPRTAGRFRGPTGNVESDRPPSDRQEVRTVTTSITWGFSMPDIHGKNGRTASRTRSPRLVPGTVTGGVAGLLACALLATGCSGSSSTTAEPGPSDTGTPAPSASATPTPTLTSYGTVEEQKKTLPKSRDGMRSGAVMGRAVAATPEEAAVADAWLLHWQVRTRAFMDAELDPTALAEVATEDALQKTIQQTKIHMKNKSFTEGVVVLNPTRITISNNTAILPDCALDNSRDVYSDGTHEMGGIISVGVRATLKKSQNSWRTAKFTFDDKLCTNKALLTDLWVWSARPAG